MLKANELREKLKREIIGQDQAVDAVVRTVVVADLGICDPRRPLGTFLFLGPTGTGKSQIGRSLAKIIHGSESDVVSINCTEFKNPHDVAKLVGAPPGYVGHDQQPFLTQEKLEKPLTIVIFEELEKADRALFDLLLQILERGELTTGRGANLNFNNCFVMMTSNVCAKEIDNITKSHVMGFALSPKKLQEMDPAAADARIRTACMGAVESFFNPEFVNRIDEIVTFNPLRYGDLVMILDRFLAETRERVAITGVLLSVSESAKRYLIEKGTNLRYGARPLRRAVREHLEFPLANLIVERETAGEFQSVRAEAINGALEFCFVKAAQAASVS
jgi:ATP-dependent Clp protease ATP-binding subunit ClpC